MGPSKNSWPPKSQMWAVMAWFYPLEGQRMTLDARRFRFLFIVLDAAKRLCSMTSYQHGHARLANITSFLSGLAAFFCCAK